MKWDSNIQKTLMRKYLLPVSGLIDTWQDTLGSVEMEGAWLGVSLGTDEIDWEGARLGSAEMEGAWLIEGAWLGVSLGSNEIEGLL